MFTVGDATYDLKFTRDRVKLYEAKTGGSLMAEFLNTRGMFPLSTVESIFSVALVDVNNKDVFVQPKKAIEIANAHMDEVGYAAVCVEIVNCLQRDMGFFFRQV